jgi:hypothetical protein
MDLFMDPIIQEARELYEAMPHDFEAGHIWGQSGFNYKVLSSIIDIAQTPQQVFSLLEKTDFYAISIPNRKIYDAMLEWHQSFFINYYNVSSPAADISWTPNLYKMLFYCLEIQGKLSFYKAIVELGGGNGQFARVAKKVLSTQVHVDIDIPPSLFMAYVYLKYWFPKSRILWVTKEQKIDFNKYDFVLIPVGLESLLHDEKFDLFVNTASLGEMSNKNIRHWFDFIQNKLSVGSVFLLNRFLNTLSKNQVKANEGWGEIRKCENEASLLLDHKWEIKKWELEPPFTRCPYEDPRIARYLEIIAQRSQEERLSDNYLELVKLEDWWRYKNVDAIGTYRSNQLVRDLTQKGTLFRLWNAIRCWGNDQTAVSMMLEYLKGMRGENVIFEEELYYASLREHLAS